MQLAVPGDVVQILLNVRHWHAASPGTAGSHFTVAEVLDGTSASWMELVEASDYLQAVSECALVE